MSNRIEEIKRRLAKVKDLKQKDADDIYHDHHVGTGISEEMCELYGNVKSDIEFLLAEIERLQTDKAGLVDAMYEIIDVSDMEYSREYHGNILIKALEKFGGE